MNFKGCLILSLSLFGVTSHTYAVDIFRHLLTAWPEAPSPVTSPDSQIFRQFTRAERWSLYLDWLRLRERVNRLTHSFHGGQSEILCSQIIFENLKQTNELIERHLIFYERICL